MKYFDQFPANLPREIYFTSAWFDFYIIITKQTLVLGNLVVVLCLTNVNLDNEFYEYFKNQRRKRRASLIWY